LYCRGCVTDERPVKGAGTRSGRNAQGRSWGKGERRRGSREFFDICREEAGGDQVPEGFRDAAEDEWCVTTWLPTRAAGVEKEKGDATFSYRNESKA